MSIQIVYNPDAPYPFAKSMRSSVKRWAKTLENQGLTVILRKFEPEKDPAIMSLLGVDWLCEDGVTPCWAVAYDDQRKCCFIKSDEYTYDDLCGAFVPRDKKRLARELIYERLQQIDLEKEEKTCLN